eukprot:m.121361 g.121361  ORF g.121361 m.121361 type:complete len:56 (+) comp9376_c3_seq1:104-271(+)
MTIRSGEKRHWIVLSLLEKVHTLDLSFYGSITDVSSLGNVFYLIVLGYNCIPSDG